MTGTGGPVPRYGGMRQESKVWLATNAASGSNDEELVARLRAMLGEGGCTIVRESDCREDELPTAASADAAGATHLLVLGGDGTLNSVLGRMEGWRGQVLPLPGGTANLLCRGLHGDSDPEAIVARFLAGELVRRRVPCVRGSDCIALAELLAGPGAKWADVREEMREGDIAGIVETATDAAGESVAGTGVRIAAPAMGRDEGYPGVRLSPWPGGVHVQGYGGEGVVDLLRQGLAILGRDFRDGPHDDLGEHAELTLESVDGHAIELMADGERLTGAPRETFSLAELEVDLLGPPA
jgi:hypothetical protein